MQSPGQRVGNVNVGVGTCVVVGGCTDVVKGYDIVAEDSSVLVCVVVMEFIWEIDHVSVIDNVSVVVRVRVSESSDVNEFERLYVSVSDSERDGVSETVIELACVKVTLRESDKDIVLDTDSEFDVVEVSDCDAVSDTLWEGVPFVLEMDTSTDSVATPVMVPMLIVQLWDLDIDRSRVKDRDAVKESVVLVEVDMETLGLSVDVRLTSNDNDDEVEGD